MLDFRAGLILAESSSEAVNENHLKPGGIRRNFGILTRSVVSWFFLTAAVALLPAFSSVAELRKAEARNVTFAIYPENSLESVALLKVKRVFTDHRHVGFFSVKVLPVVVAQGVRLEMASATPNTNWLASFHTS